MRPGGTILRPVFEELYQRVEQGDDTRRVLEANSRKDYREQLEKELKAVADSEMWQAGAVVRALRPERAEKPKS
jgi:ketol-acid reductoisomerase